MEDVIASAVEIKNCQTPILRITANGSDLQGRVLFSQGGFILGGKVNVSSETGWEAVRMLLSVKDGNYAVLDPGRKTTHEINQSLWIACEKLVPLLHNLPLTPESLVDHKPDLIHESAARPKTGQIDLAPLMAAVGAPKDDPHTNLSDNIKVHEEHRQTTSAKAASRKYNEGRWRTIKFIIQVGGALVVCYVMMTNSATMWEWTAQICKMCGNDIENNELNKSFQNAMVNVFAKKVEEAKKKGTVKKAGSHH